MSATLSLPTPHHGAAMSGPPWRTLAWLGSAVLLAHVMVLQTDPSVIGLSAEPPAPRATPLITRQITRQITPPPVQVAAPTVAPPVAKPAVRKKPPARASEAPPLAAETLAPSVAEVAPPTVPEGAETAAQSAATPIPQTPEPPASTASAPAAPTGPVHTPVTAMSLPPSTQLAYTMTGNAKGLTYHANATLVWNTSGTQYDARMTVSALFLGSRSMASTGQVGAEGLAPTRFSDKSRSEVAAHFEPDKGQITFSANTPSAPWTQGAQDRVSVFMQLGGMLAGNPAAFPQGSTISVYTVGPRDADTWTFAVEAPETLQLPFGELSTLKLSRQPRREFDQKVEIWYAPSLGYLPVRNRITQANGDFIDQQLKSVTAP